MATSEENKRYRNRRRAEYIRRLGGRCAKCGTTRSLEFDHVDPATKRFAISTGIVKYGADHPEMEGELKKCQLLCRKHHREKTTNEERDRRQFSHGTIYAWMKQGCTCDVCVKAKWDWHDNRNSKRRKRSTSNRSSRAGVA